MRRLAIVTTHVVQYYAPVFQMLSSHLDIHVFYTWGESSLDKYDRGFDKKVSWDLPLLSGYPFTFLKNLSKNPGSHSFFGVRNPDLNQKIEEFKPDAILFYGWAYHSHLSSIIHFYGKIPVWFRGDSHFLVRSSVVRSTLRAIFLRWVYSYVDKALYVGSANRDYFLQAGVSKDKLFFVPHAVDNERFYISSSSRGAEIRRELGLEVDDVLILFAGKFDSIKNIHALVRTFIQIDNPRAHLLLVGDGILRESLRKEAEASTRIHFVGFQNQSVIPDYYQASDLFCLPSKSETWGLAVNEAMAAGKAILVSNKVGCAMDLVFPGINGEIFDIDSQDDLARKLGALMEKEKLAKMGEKSKSIIEDWSFKKQVSQILSAFEKVN